MCQNSMKSIERTKSKKCFGFTLQYRFGNLPFHCDKYGGDRRDVVIGGRYQSEKNEKGGNNTIVVKRHRFTLSL